MAKRKQTGTEKVGYCNPPKHSEFKKGQSGNPGGRPKGSRSLAAEIRAQGDELVTLTVNGKRVRRTKRQFLAQLGWAEALKGNHKYFESINKVDRDPPSEDVAGDREIEVTLVFPEEDEAQVIANRAEFARECPNYDPDRPMEEWGPDDPDSVH